MRGILAGGVTVLVLGLLAAGCATSPVPVGEGPAGLEITALDRYVWAPDPNYEYELVRTIDGDGYTGYVLAMTSQAWLTVDLVDRPLWKHWLTIVRPDEVGTDKGLLFIGGGSNNDPAPTAIPERFTRYAMETNSVVAELRMVPNQPLTFVDESHRKRNEDAIIAYTWDKYLRTGDEKWPLRLPMTKSAVRAMDTITSFCASEAGGGIGVDVFVVAGGSKRGWTTWTTAAVDKRVIGIMPIVIDMLNVEPSFIHHFRVYGRYARAVGDYLAMDLMDWTGEPEYRRLMEIVEPFEYRKRLTMPKYIVNSTGDQFFIPDSSQFYFDDLVGEKYLRYVPNGDHGLAGTDVADNLLAWYHSVVHGVPHPRFTWRIEDDGAIRVLTLDEPTEVRLWRATNPDARNFQKQVIGAAYASQVLLEREDGVYIGRVPVPESGWTAYFVELTYPSGTTVPFKFTTAVHVLPDVYPYEFKYSKPKDHAPGFLQK